MVPLLRYLGTEEEARGVVAATLEEAVYIRGDEGPDEEDGDPRSVEVPTSLAGEGVLGAYESVSGGADQRAVVAWA